MEFVYSSPKSGVSTSFSPGHISLMVAFKGPNVILGLYNCYLKKEERKMHWKESTTN